MFMPLKGLSCLKSKVLIFFLKGKMIKLCVKRNGFSFLSEDKIFKHSWYLKSRKIPIMTKDYLPAIPSHQVSVLMV